MALLQGLRKPSGVDFCAMQKFDVGAEQNPARKQCHCSTKTEPSDTLQLWYLTGSLDHTGNLWCAQAQKQKTLHFVNISWVMDWLFLMGNPLPACLSASPSRSEALLAHAPSHVMTGRFGWICVRNFSENTRIIQTWSVFFHTHIIFLFLMNFWSEFLLNFWFFFLLTVTYGQKQ